MIFIAVINYVIARSVRIYLCLCILLITYVTAISFFARMGVWCVQVVFLTGFNSVDPLIFFIFGIFYP